MNLNPEAMRAHNAANIEEFRAHHGRLAAFGDTPVLVLHSTGAKSATERLNPMVYQAVGDEWAVFASKAGAPTNPDWYYNLIANPNATIEIGTPTGTESIDVTAREITGAQRDPIWTKQKADAPGFAEYERQATGRTIPVLLLLARS